MESGMESEMGSGNPALKKGLLVVAIVAVIAVIFAVMSRNKAPHEMTQTAQMNSASTATNIDSAQPKAGPFAFQPVTELKVEDLQAGSGDEAAPGKMVTVHYTGWLTDGRKFDSSLDHGQPFKFMLGAGQVIPGWDQGVKGMKVGGKRRLTIPPQLAYGERGAGALIPPNASLMFDVELLAVGS